MKETFTEQQREIVARKMGYDGPMQMFDEYLASTPSDATKYAAITSKYATKMAKGGYVVKLAQGGAPDQIQEVWRGEDPPDPSEGYTRYKTGRDDYLYKRPKREATPAPASAPIQESRSKAEPPPFDPNNPVGMEEATLQVVVYGPDGTAYGTPAAARAAGVNQYYRQDGTPYPYSGQPTGSFTQQNDGSGEIPVAPSPTFAFPATTDVTGAMRPAVTSAGTTQAPAAAIISPAEVKTVTAPAPVQATGITATTSQAAIQAEAEKARAAQGVVSEGAKTQAATGVLSKEAIAAQQKVAEQYKAPATAQVRTTGAGEMVTAETTAPKVVAEAAQTAAPQAVVAAQGTVQENQLVQAAQIRESDMAQSKALVSQDLNVDATAVAAKMAAFTVDEGTLAQAAQGDVNALSTVQGQLSSLMKSFDDGATPTWAVGAIRAANAVMASRGLGGSSMAATAVFQAAMESALPIAAQDAKAFESMNMQNLNNRQQVALSNAAAQQGVSLQNTSNEQQARLTNAVNSFALQSQNISNTQQTMLANTQIRAALQGQNLTNSQQAAVLNAARYAEQANINLNNLQQAALHDSAMQVQVNMANTSNRQQAALANAQIEAAMQGKVLDNKQQAAVLNSARIAENASLTFNAAQTTTLHNSEMMKSIGLAELNTAQSTTIANAAAAASLDLANLNNRQQANTLISKAFLETDMKNLDNNQQMAVIKSQTISQAILSDTSAQNAAKATNAANALEADKLNASLALTASQYNASEQNRILVSNNLAVNEVARFNASEANKREEFNATMSNQINIANAKLLADISTANTREINATNAVNAKLATDMSASTYAQQMQTYRDLLEMSYKVGENDKDRLTEIATATITANASKTAAEIKSAGDSAQAWGQFIFKAFDSWKIF